VKYNGTERRPQKIGHPTSLAGERKSPNVSRLRHRPTHDGRTWGARGAAPVHHTVTGNVLPSLYERCSRDCIPCPSALPERKRLTNLYLESVVKNNEAGKAATDMKSLVSRDATKETREAYQDALADLNAHRQEHGC
jgi:hypothetical protein